MTGLSRSLWLSVMFFSLALAAAGQPAPTNRLMPVPAEVRFGTGGMALDSSFTISLEGYTEPRLEAAAERLLEHLTAQTGVLFMPGALKSSGEPADLVIETGAPGGFYPGVREDESYRLTVAEDGARLVANSPYGALRGMETFRQLAEVGGSGMMVRAAQIQDAPRFPWRGQHFDVARHWMPKDVVLRTLDGMAAVKMNVLHFHLTDDQGFRIESRAFPCLHEYGSDGHYFTQEEIREIIEYARLRGIRVVPEFDMPGHTTAWFAGHPELAAAPGPYEIERGWGIFDPAMDPTKESVYRFLDTFIGEMAALFPDTYFHIGGDEVTGKPWTDSPRIQAFIKDNDLKDNHGLQTYFTRRVQEIVARNGKQMMGWDEILHPDLPTSILVHSWRGQKSLAEAARQGYEGILSAGYYLDLMLPASEHYAVDPLGGDAANLTLEEQNRILGGESAMWAELVTPETMDSRIWPRAAAIAEKLWSPAEKTTDIDDMYRRLDITSKRLAALGLKHRSNYRVMLERLTDYAPVEPLQTLADLLEPVKRYQRHRGRKLNQATAYNRLIDALRPESDSARVFAADVAAYLSDRSESRAERLRNRLERWQANRAALAPVIDGSPMLAEIDGLSADLAAVAGLGLQALDALQNGGSLPQERVAEDVALLDRAAEPHAKMLLMVVPPIRDLVMAAHLP